MRVLEKLCEQSYFLPLGGKSLNDFATSSSTTLSQLRRALLGREKFFCTLSPRLPS